MEDVDVRAGVVGRGGGGGGEMGQHELGEVATLLGINCNLHILMRKLHFGSEKVS